MLEVLRYDQSLTQSKAIADTVCETWWGEHLKER